MFCDVFTGEGFGGSGTELYDTVRDCTDVRRRPTGVNKNYTEWYRWLTGVYGTIWVCTGLYGCVRDYTGVYGCVWDYTDGLRV